MALLLAFSVPDKVLDETDADRWMDGRMDGWMDGWMVGWLDGGWLLDG